MKHHLKKELIEYKKGEDEKEKKKKEKIINNIKKSKEKEKKMKELRDDPDRFKKLINKVKDMEEELILKIEVYLVENEIDYDDCIFEKFNDVDDKNKCSVEFTCFTNDQLKKGDADFCKIDGEWKIEKLNIS
jgi:hypothetical protein